MEANYFTILCWFCHTSTWIHHRCTRIPHPEPPSSFLPVPSLWVIPVHQPQASYILHQTWTGDSFLIWYYTCFNAILPNHPTLALSQSPKDCSIHLCLFCCLAYRVIVTIFLNSIYMHLYTILVYKLECKSRKSRNTWSNRQIWPWNTEWSRAKTNRVLPRKCTGHSKYPLPTTQEKTRHMDITRWSTPKSDWLYSLQPKIEKLYTVSKNKTRSWLWLRPWTPYCQIQT